MTGASWSSIEKMEQARWLRFATEHQAESVFCDTIMFAHQRTGRSVSQADAAQLARLATLRGWPIPSVGRAAAKRRKKQQRT